MNNLILIKKEKVKKEKEMSSGSKSKNSSITNDDSQEKSTIVGTTTPPIFNTNIASRIGTFDGSNVEIFVRKADIVAKCYQVDDSTMGMMCYLRCHQKLIKWWIKLMSI